MEEENKDKLDNKKNVKESVSCDNNEKVKKIDAKSEKEDNKKDKEKETITNEKSIKTNKIKFNILAIFSIIIFSIALTPVTFQNDTYYTIAIGKDIVETGTIDMKDHFSWHEDLEYTYPHWLYDVGTYLVYQLGENIGIGGFTAIYILTVLLSITLGLVIYMACVKISKHHITSFLITMGIMYLLKNFITARAQLVTFILFALTVLFIEEFIASKKKRYAIGLIIISILIANLHVAVWPFYFVLYLPYVAQYMIALISTSKLGYKINKKFKESRLKSLEKAKLNKKEIKDLDEKIEKIKNKIIEIEKSHDKSEKSAEKRRNNPYKIVIEKQDAVKWLILIMVICAFTGLLTPLGDTPYTYLSKTMEGNTMDNISEHQPLTLINNMEMIICIILVLGLITFTDTKIKLCDLFMLGGLLYLSFMSRRQVSMFDIIGGIIFARIVASFFDKYDVGGEEKLLKSINTIYGKAITILVVILISFNILKPKLDDKFVDENTYPVKASDYIIENVDLSTLPICPKCNKGHMQPRNGKYGAFLGCTNYPTCKHTQPIDGETSTGESNITLSEEEKKYKCPRCKEGYFVKQEARGRINWVCSNRSQCKTQCSDVNGTPSIYANK